MRWLGATAAVLVVTSCVGGPTPGGAWDPFDAGDEGGIEAGPPEPPAPDVGLGTFEAGPTPVTDAGCPAAYPRDGTPCAYVGGPPLQVCTYAVHGGSLACTCTRPTPESDDTWRCRRP